MSRTSNPEDPQNQEELAEEKFVQAEAFQSGWGGMTQALGAAEKELREVEGE